MSAATQARPFVMTTDEFLGWDAPGGRERWELIDGIPVMMAPSDPFHALIQAETARLIGNHLVERRPGCRIVTEPGVQPRVRGRTNVRVPDLAVTCTMPERGDRMLRQPLVIVEILSSSNSKHTWDNVWAYTTIPGVREILIFHTTEIRVDLLAVSDDHTWPSDPVTLTDGETVRLDSIGFSAPVAAFYRDVLV